MGGFFSMEQNARRNNGPNLEKGEGGFAKPAGANAPRTNNASNVNLEAGQNNTRRNNVNARRNTTNRRNNVAINVRSIGTSDPEELEEVVVHSPPNSPRNTAVNVNRPPNNNGRINVVATNVQAPLPPNTTPEGEEQVGGRRRRRRSRRSKRSRRGKSKRRTHN